MVGTFGRMPGRFDAAAWTGILRWLMAGAPFGSPDLRVTGITVEPTDRLLPDIGAQMDLHVTAAYSDGSKRDVTRLALFGSNDDGVVEVGGTGRLYLP